MGGVTHKKADFDRDIESRKSAIEVQKKWIEHYRETKITGPNGKESKKRAIQTCKDRIASLKREIAVLKEKRKNAPK